MKKIIAIMLAVVMCAVMPLIGADEETIDVTLTPLGIIDITVQPGTWAPDVGIDDEFATEGGYFNITNVGNIPVNVDIFVNDTENQLNPDDNWELNETADHDKFVMLFNFTHAGDWINTYDIFTPFGEGSFLTDFKPHVNNYYEFDLKVIMPTSSGTTDEQTTVITFNATAVP